MSGSDDFSGVSSDTPLSARSKWTLLAGSDSVVVTPTGLLKKLSSATAVCCYVRPDDGSKEQIAGLDMPAVVSGGPVVLASGTDVNSFNAYILRISNTTTAQVRRINNGVVESAGLFAVTLPAAGIYAGLELRATVAADNSVTIIEVWQGTSKLGEHHDNTPNRKTSGRRGIATTTTNGIANFGDNYSDNYTDPSNLSIGVPAVPFYENFSGPATMGVTGTVQSAVAAIQARLIQVDANGAFVSVVEGFDWTTKVASPPAVGQAYSFNFDNPPRGGPYRVQVRDSANRDAVTTGSTDRHVSAVIGLWGQSQMTQLVLNTSPEATVPAGARVYALILNPRLNPGSPGYARVTTTSSHGAGLKSLASQWYEDNGSLPLMLVDLSIVGQSIDTFLNDLMPPGTSGGGTWTWTAWTGFVTTMMAAAYNRFSGFVFMQGGSDVGSRGTYAARMQQLADKFDALTGRTTYPFIVLPHPRVSTGVNTWDMRNIQYNKAISGGRWRFAGFSLDSQLDLDASPHMLTGPTGGSRTAAVIGRAIGVHLNGLNLPVRGPSPVSQVLSSDRTAITLTFDRDIKTRSGATTVLPGFWVSTDGGASYPPGLANGIGQITGPRTVVVTKVDDSTFASGPVRIDLYRGIPFSSDTGTPDYVGPESAMEANYLSKMLTDTSTFNGGQGMTAAPAMNSGYAVTEAGNYVLIDNQGGAAKLVTLTKAQAATLRFAAGTRVASAGAEPIGLRWERKVGDLTGKPIDGINVPVTVTE